MSDKICDECWPNVVEYKAKIKDLTAKLATAEKERDELTAVLEEYKDALNAKFADMSRQFIEVTVPNLQAENTILKEFACQIIRQECWAYEPLDPCDIQDFAERLGLIAKHIAAEDDVDESGDIEVGDKIYKFTPILSLKEDNKE